MRQFLYYNHDSINSFLAQIEQGLLLKKEADETRENTTSSTGKIQSNVTGDLSAKILGIGASLQGDIKGTNSDTEIATQMVRNIQEKALHDYAFNKVFDYIDSNSLINNEDPQIGDIILVNELPTFLDFNYFQALFSDNGPVNFSNEQSKKQMDDKLVEMRRNVPKGASMPELIKIQIKNLESKIKGAEPERKEMVRIIEAIRNTLPYDRFVMTNNLLIPLNDKYFRDDPNIIAFKYGGLMSIFGYVTNIIIDDENTVCPNVFSPVYDTVNKMMLTFFNDKDKVFILHPIALYYQV